MDNAIMERAYTAVADFDRFRSGERVKMTLYPEYLEAKAISGSADVQVPYSDVKIVCHCKKADLTGHGETGAEPMYAGEEGEAWGSLLDSALAAGKAQPAGSRYDYTLLDHLFLIGYQSDGKELWIALQEAEDAEANRFAKELARLADTEVVKSLRKLKREIR